jgi:hypothetical protein
LNRIRRELAKANNGKVDERRALELALDELDDEIERGLP